MEKMVLGKEALDRAGAFIETKGRPLEKARFHYHFRGGPAGDVMAELKKFQNRDGGFGKALEPDVRALESSALCTSVAFQLIREIRTDASDAMASTAIGYLLDTFDNTGIVWRIIPETTGNSPHPPWWEQEGLAERFNNFSLNPTAELLGYLYQYGKDVVPQDRLLTIWDRVLSCLSDLEKIEMHDFFCCKRLIETEGLDAKLKTQLVDNIQRLVMSTISLESAEWSEYGLQPVQVANSPDSPFFEAVRDVVAENLDYDIRTQQEDGSWAANFSWLGMYPDEFEKVKLEWAGVQAVEKLITLKNYARIQGVA